MGAPSSSSANHPGYPYLPPPPPLFPIFVPPPSAFHPGQYLHVQQPHPSTPSQGSILPPQAERAFGSTSVPPPRLYPLQPTRITLPMSIVPIFPQTPESFNPITSVNLPPPSRNTFASSPIPNYQDGQTCSKCDCFRPTFAVISPCGCTLCRDHLGSVIRNVTLIDEGAVSPRGKELKKKYFECVACGKKSLTVEPAGTRLGGREEGRIELSRYPLAAGENEVSSPASDAFTFSVHFTSPSTPSTPVFEAEQRDVAPPQTVTHPSTPSGRSTPQPGPVWLPPPPPPYDLTRRPRAFSTPVPTPAPCPSESPAVPSSTSSPSALPSIPSIQISARINNAAAKKAGARRLSLAEIQTLREIGSQRWCDGRGPLHDATESYQLRRGLWPVVKIENVSLLPLQASIH